MNTIQGLSNDAIYRILEIILEETGLKLDKTLKGTANGLAELDASGKVPAAQLPSYVDDVLEGYLYNDKFYTDAAHTTEITGESGKIYTELTTNKVYRWSGTAFVPIPDGVALGETESSAYRGDRGKEAYDHSQLLNGNPHNVTKTDVGLGNVENISPQEIMESYLTGDNILDSLGYTPIATPKTAGTTGQVLKLDADGKPVWNFDTDTTYQTGTDTIDGLTRLYATLGDNEDGTVTQKALKEELSKKLSATNVSEITAAEIDAMYTELKNA